MKIESIARWSKINTLCRVSSPCQLRIWPIGVALCFLPPTMLLSLASSCKNGTASKTCHNMPQYASVPPEALPLGPVQKTKNIDLFSSNQSCFDKIGRTVHILHECTWRTCSGVDRLYLGRQDTCGIYSLSVRNCEKDTSHELEWRVPRHNTHWRPGNILLLWEMHLYFILWSFPTHFLIAL